MVLYCRSDHTVIVTIKKTFLFLLCSVQFSSPGYVPYIRVVLAFRRCEMLSRLLNRKTKCFSKITAICLLILKSKIYFLNAFQHLFPRKVCKTCSIKSMTTCLQMQLALARLQKDRAVVARVAPKPYQVWLTIYSGQIFENFLVFSL